MRIFFNIIQHHSVSANCILKPQGEDTTANPLQWLKFKQTNNTKCWQYWYPHTLLVGMQNSTTTLGKVVVVSYDPTFGSTFYPTIPFLYIYPQRNESTCP